jgi:hypothetical protein
MRNLFDQDKHPEKQLTHALFSALDADCVTPRRRVASALLA